MEGAQKNAAEGIKHILEKKKLFVYGEKKVVIGYQEKLLGS